MFRVMVHQRGFRFRTFGLSLSRERLPDQRARPAAFSAVVARRLPSISADSGNRPGPAAEALRRRKAAGWTGFALEQPSVVDARSGQDQGGPRLSQTGHAAGRGRTIRPARKSCRDEDLTRQCAGIRCKIRTNSPCRRAQRGVCGGRLLRSDSGLRQPGPDGILAD